jgi:hypothetical protein
MMAARWSWPHQNTPLEQTYVCGTEESEEPSYTVMRVIIQVL